MEPVKPERVLKQLESWQGQTVYVHLEVNPGAYWRNGEATLKRAHVKGSGHVRVYLEFEGDSLIHIDDLTHMELTSDMVICTGYDSNDRIARTVEVSVRPFKM